MKTLMIASLFLCFTVVGANAQVTSKYTSLSDKICKTAEFSADEGGSYRGICPGVAGYKLELIEGDLRQTIIIVDPKKKEHNLKFWEIFGGFSAVDRRAEWRIKSGKPYALIVRLNVNEDPEKIEKRTSYLLVAKITPTETCVTDVIKPSRAQNIEARKAADASASKPCYTRGENP